MQCPLVVLEKVGWKQGKVFGSEESDLMGTGINLPYI
jgi:hypothetical protein